MSENEFRIETKDPIVEQPQRLTNRIIFNSWIKKISQSIKNGFKKLINNNNENFLIFIGRAYYKSLLMHYLFYYGYSILKPIQSNIISIFFLLLSDNIFLIIFKTTGGSKIYDFFLNMINILLLNLNNQKKVYSIIRFFLDLSNSKFIGDILSKCISFLKIFLLSFPDKIQFYIIAFVIYYFKRKISLLYKNYIDKETDTNLTQNDFYKINQTCIYFTLIEIFIEGIADYILDYNFRVLVFSHFIKSNALRVTQNQKAILNQLVGIASSKEITKFYSNLQLFIQTVINRINIIVNPSKFFFETYFFYLIILRNLLNFQFILNSQESKKSLSEKKKYLLQKISKFVEFLSITLTIFSIVSTLLTVSTYLIPLYISAWNFNSLVIKLIDILTLTYFLIFEKLIIIGLAYTGYFYIFKFLNDDNYKEKIQKVSSFLILKLIKFFKVLGLLLFILLLTNIVLRVMTGEEKLLFEEIFSLLFNMRFKNIFIFVFLLVANPLICLNLLKVDTCLIKDDIHIDFLSFQTDVKYVPSKIPIELTSLIISYFLIEEKYL